MPLGPAELARLIDRHAEPLRLFAGCRCASPEDAVQDVFCRLVTLDPPPDRPGAWLYAAVRNAAASQVRAHVRQRRLENRVSEPERQEIDPTTALVNAELIREVERLDDSLREVLVARIWGEMTLEEIAGLCGISVATAFRRYQAALEQIRNRMEMSCLNRTK